MADADSRVTIHMVASLDGFIARREGSVDWLETSDDFEDGESLDPGSVERFLTTIDCYVMGSRTYETALVLKRRASLGRTVTNPPSCSRAESCPRPGTRSSSILAIQGPW